MQHDDPRRLLQPWGAIAIIVGIVIGAGIFKTPSMVAGISGDPGWAITIWAAGALLSLAGALCYAELSTTYPHAGGDYHFLAKAYGKEASFLYAWAKAMVINTGAIALLAFVFGDYMSEVLRLGEHSAVIWALLIVIALTLFNILGIQASAGLQTTLLVLQLAGLAAMVFAGVFLTTPTQPNPAAFSSAPPLGLMGLAMVFVLLTFGGWNEAAYISSEVKGGPKAVVPVIVISLGIITVAYLLINWALIHGLGISGLAQSKAPGAAVMQAAYGPVGQKIIGLVVALAALTSINATMVVGARSNYALGKDWPQLGFLAQWEGEKGAPTLAYLIQGAICLALVGFGALQTDGFEAMVEFTAPVFWVFLTLVGISVFVMRAREPLTQRPFKVPLYPMTPILFCASSAYLAYSSVMYAASRSAVHVSLWVMAAGVAAMVALKLAHRLVRKP